MELTNCAYVNLISGLAGIITGTAMGLIDGFRHDGKEIQSSLRAGIAVGSTAMCDMIQSCASGLNSIYLVDDLAAIPGMYFGLKLGNKLFRFLFRGLMEDLDSVVYTR